MICQRNKGVQQTRARLTQGKGQGGCGQKGPCQHRERDGGAPKEERTFMKCLPPRSECREPLLSGGRLGGGRGTTLLHMITFKPDRQAIVKCGKTYSETELTCTELLTHQAHKSATGIHYRTICPCGMFNSNPLALRGVGVRPGGLFWMRPLVYIASFNVPASWKGNSSKQMSRCSWAHKCIFRLSHLCISPFMTF